MIFPDLLDEEKYLINSTYPKPFATAKEQIEKLKSHGLRFQDEDNAARCIHRYGYYHLSGYTHALLDPSTLPNDKNYLPGASFEVALEFYKFDAVLRSLINEATSIIETRLRSAISTSFGKAHPFAHKIPSFCNPIKTKWTVKSTYNSKNQHVFEVRPSPHFLWNMVHSSASSHLIKHSDYAGHFQNKYGNDLPIWTLVEGLQFGSLNKLYELLPEPDRNFISLQFGAINKDGTGNNGTLSNWLDCVRYIRNVSAHQGRVWNKNFNQEISLPQASEKPSTAKELREALSSEKSRRRSYGYLCILRYILLNIDPENKWYIKIKYILKTFLQKNSKYVLPESLGIDYDWENDIFWSPQYNLSGEIRENQSYVEALNNSGFIGRSKAVNAIQNYFPNLSLKEAKEKLDYFVRKKALLSIKIGSEKYYPSFQFDWDRKKDVYFFNPEVCNINEELFKIAPGNSPTEKTLAVLARWQE